VRAADDERDHLGDHVEPRITSWPDALPEE
jgi:hypothetical protein